MACILLVGGCHFQHIFITVLYIYCDFHPNLYPTSDSVQETSWLHRASNNVETFLLPTDAHNVKKHRVIKTF